MTFSYVDPACKQCGRTESRCAFRGGCCLSCTHFANLDANGDEIFKPIGRPRLSRVSRPVNLSAARLARITRIREQWERDQQQEHA